MKFIGLLQFVSDLDRTVSFYQDALALQEVARKDFRYQGEDYTTVHFADGASKARVIAAAKQDGEMPSFDRGENEVHHCYIARDYEAAYARHKAMDSIVYENKGMGLYFIADPDNHWIEIVPDRRGAFQDGPEFTLVHYNRNVQTLEIAEHFYQQVLELEPSRETAAEDRSFTLRFLQDAATGFELELTYLLNHKDRAYDIGDGLDTLVFETERDLADIAAEARSHAYEVKELVFHQAYDAMNFLSLEDPDGYRIFIIQAASEPTGGAS